MWGTSMKMGGHSCAINSVLFSTETKLLWILVEQCVGVVESVYHFHWILWQCAVWRQTSAKCHKKPQFERVARAQYPIQEKKCTVHVQQLTLCVKCCHICGFIRRHLASQTCSDHIATRKTDWLWKGTSHCMAPRPHLQARSGQPTWSSPTQSYRDWINASW